MADIDDVVPGDPEKPADVLEESKRSEIQLGLLTREFSGPLPPADLLYQYDQVVPGGAERIFKAFEKETEHRHQVERSLVQAEIADQKSARSERRIGQFLAFGLCLTALICGSYVAVRGAEWAGGFIGVGGLGGLASVFIYGRSHDRSDDEQGTRDTQEERND